MDEKKLTQDHAVSKIKKHILGCIRSKKEYIKAEDYYAAADMKSRIEGLEIALEYIMRISIPSAVKNRESKKKNKCCNNPIIMPFSWICKNCDNLIY